MKNVYFAGRFSQRQNLLQRSKDLKHVVDINVTSRWLFGLHGSAEDFAAKKDQDFYEMCAAEDLFDIDNSDTFILFSEDPKQLFCRGGRMVEYGYALAKQKRMIVIGPAQNIFMLFPCVTRYETWEDFIRQIRINNYYASK